MAGDKGAEVPASAKEYLQRPKAVKEALDYYKKPAPSNTFRSAISRAVDSLRQRGRQLPSNETGRRMVEKMGEETPPNKIDPDHRSRNVRTLPTMMHNIRTRHEILTDAQKEKYFGANQEEKIELQSEE